MKSIIAISIVGVMSTAFYLLSNHKETSQDRMVMLLQESKKKAQNPFNEYNPQSRLNFIDSLLKTPQAENDIIYENYMKANVLLQIGKTERSLEIYEKLLKKVNESQVEIIRKDVALADLRIGEQSNCILHHSSASCILPIKGIGIYADTKASLNAIKMYEEVLDKKPDDLDSRWLLNIAYMTIGKYPKDVPERFLIPGMEGDTTYKVNAFEDVASDLGLDVNNMSGGSIVEDFDNDGYLDIMTSGYGDEDEIHYFRNEADGTYSDHSSKTGLKGITGGLNIMQTDYNNDGFKDVFVLRGAWKGEFGNQPNSLLRNNGDGTFTDVTIISGLLSFHPTQTATWNDFNNDGWLDVFIGNETVNNEFPHPCQLYINNHNGTFREIAKTAGCSITAFVKGVTSGDFDNDGWKDIYLSTMSGKRILLRNGGNSGKEIVFVDVTASARLDDNRANSFPTWFWDYDNDGWLDIFTCDFSVEYPLGYYAAAEKLNIPAGNTGRMMLYKNNHDGTFANVTNDAGLNKVVFPMGSNFGDIDNDGFLDMYLGTGNPSYASLVPNKMYKNLDGKSFADVTTSARVGHLQKGHGVSFADMDNDGDQDIYIDMGGAYPGDSYQNSFFLNPGQGSNHWISIQLEGTTSNRAAIGTAIRLTFKENGIERKVYRDVNSGGSFGSSPFRREIGVGQATMIDEIEIRWHGSKTVQVFKNVKPDQFIKVVEGIDEIKPVLLKKIQWTLPERLCDPITGNGIGGR